ncbi:hypothetical protein FBU30_005502 [Linnemannia zychae]|nr:hypothetical protein FBU30_005502 [Linnemannia zychae]
MSSYSHPALNAPEILFNIGSFMTMLTLVASLRVNRYFHQTLEQLLYANLILDKHLERRPTVRTVKSRLHYVHHLFTDHFILSGYLALKFRHLISITLQANMQTSK